ncbi:MAG: DNA repair protein RecO [Firmicutes bacterium]|nr:DNA repair protein RecO [Bacillota bacterium]
MGLYRTEGIVLRTKDLGDADKILTIFTADAGKVAVVSKGCRRVRNRLIGVSAPFVHLRALIFKGKSLDTLSQGEILHSFIDLREDLLKMAYASYLAEVVDQLTAERDPVPQVFQLLLGCFHLLSRGHSPEIVARYFDINVLSLLGYRPQLDVCTQCGANLEQPRLSLTLGGGLCRQCHPQDPAAVPLSLGAVQMLRRFMVTPVERLPVLQVSEEMLQEMERGLRLFMDYRLARPLNSLSWLNTIRTVS